MANKDKRICKICAKEFEFLVSQRRNPTYCSKVCQLEFLRRPNNPVQIKPEETSIYINKKDPGWVQQLFGFLTGK